MKGSSLGSAIASPLPIPCLGFSLYWGLHNEDKNEYAKLSFRKSLFNPGVACPKSGITRGGELHVRRPRSPGAERTLQPLIRLARMDESRASWLPRASFITPTNMLIWHEARGLQNKCEFVCSHTAGVTTVGPSSGRCYRFDWFT